MVTVRIHYYGSVFELSHAMTDDDWLEHIDAELILAAENGGARMRVNLFNGTAAWLSLHPGTHLAVTSSKSEKNRSPTPTDA